MEEVASLDYGSDPVTLLLFFLLSCIYGCPYTLALMQWTRYQQKLAIKLERDQFSGKASVEDMEEGDEEGEAAEGEKKFSS